MSTTTNDIELHPLGLDDLKALAETSKDCCVSIQMPTHRSGRDVKQNSIRFKNLLDEADRKLISCDADISILNPLRSLPNQDDFWQHQADGLAVFVNSRNIQFFSTQRSIDNRVTVDNSFYLASLLGERYYGEECFVLALTWDDAKLFISSGSELRAVDSMQFPAKYDDLVLPSDPEEQIQFTTHRAGGESTAMYHGQGEGEDKIEADRCTYLSRVGGLVGSEIYNSGMALVIVATEEVAGQFAATTNVEIAAKVEGSPAEMKEDELQSRVCEAVEPVLVKSRNELAERFGTELAQSQASGDPAEVATAALQGRVDTLIVAEQAEVPGIIDREKMQTRTDESGDVDLVNAAVIETFRHGGTAYSASDDAMPSEANRVAAIYRY